MLLPFFFSIVMQNCSCRMIAPKSPNFEGLMSLDDDLDVVS
jgi:hypothetical protein